MLLLKGFLVRFPKFVFSSLAILLAFVVLNLGLGQKLSVYAETKENLYISEINFRGSISDGKCQKNTGKNLCSKDQWLEIHNPLKENISLNGWTISFRPSQGIDNKIVALPNISLVANSRFVIGYAAENFVSVIDSKIDLATSRLNYLSNDSENNGLGNVQVYLRNASQKLVDSLNQTEKSFGSGYTKKGISFERCNAYSSWQASTTNINAQNKGTPGEGVYCQPTEQKPIPIVKPEPKIDLNEKTNKQSEKSTKTVATNPQKQTQAQAQISQIQTNSKAVISSAKVDAKAVVNQKTSQNALNQNNNQSVVQTNLSKIIGPLQKSSINFLNNESQKQLSDSLQFESQAISQNVALSTNSNNESVFNFSQQNSSILYLLDMVLIVCIAFRFSKTFLSSTHHFQLYFQVF